MTVETAIQKSTIYLPDSLVHLNVKVEIIMQYITH